jgi:hypothetical protein
MKKLIETPGKNPFRVPENYFDDVNRKIISAASGFETEAKKISLFRRIKPYLAIAAFVSGFILISYTAFKLFGPTGIVTGSPQVSIQEYSESYLNDIDITTLEERGAAFLLSDKELEFDNTDIIDYLLLENIDIYEIYEHL